MRRKDGGGGRRRTRAVAASPTNDRHRADVDVNESFSNGADLPQKFLKKRHAGLSGHFFFAYAGTRIDAGAVKPDVAAEAPFSPTVGLPCQRGGAKGWVVRETSGTGFDPWGRIQMAGSNAHVVQGALQPSAGSRPCPSPGSVDRSQCKEVAPPVQRGQQPSRRIASPGAAASWCPFHIPQIQGHVRKTGVTAPLHGSP